MAVPPEPADTVAGSRIAADVVTVKVVLMGELRRWAGGKREVEVQMPVGSTLQALAGRVAALCGPGFAQRALTKEGAWQPHVAVFINGVQMGELEGTKTVLSGGQVELMLLPTYEGG